MHCNIIKKAVPDRYSLLIYFEEYYKLVTCFVIEDLRFEAFFL